ncbi:LuxR C-terminal-related transcriptional regulator [Nocardia sp. NPDC051052]|uniref:LuxR C-terminal-related transcriptional regulator n=1 Tax=Nocardia sp. NPDC051052 TaxID=3364322 RepID=UPI0037B0CB41
MVVDLQWVVGADVLGEAGGTHVLVLTTYDSDANLYRALQAEASGFLLKSLPPEELVAAIRIAARGDALIDPSMTRRLATRFATTLAPPHTPAEVDQLTARELEVLLLLGVGAETVKTHVSRVLAKLGVRDRIHAVVYAHEHGLVAGTPPGYRRSAGR